MAFDIRFFTSWSGASAGIADDNPSPANATTPRAPSAFSYLTTDTQEQCMADGYFNTVRRMLKIGDLISVVCITTAGAFVSSLDQRVIVKTARTIRTSKSKSFDAVKTLRMTPLSDSLMNRHTYFPFGLTNSEIPLWTAGAVNTAGMICRTTLGHIYYTAAGGTNGGTEPTHITGSASDGGTTWFYYPSFVAKDSSSALFWAEKFSNGAVKFDLTLGYAHPQLSLHKIIVISRGQKYRSTDTIGFTVAGAKATLNVNPVDGGIDSVTVTNGGYNVTGALDYTITTLEGSGAVLSLVFGGSGGFGVSGLRTRDGLARVPDVIASGADVAIVDLGTNDGTLDVVSFATAPTVGATVIAQLREIYERLTAAGILVVAVPLGPKTRSAAAAGLISPVLAFHHQVRRWMRAFYNKEAWANPNGISIALADHLPYWADGATASDPIGIFTPSIGAVTVDGTHPSPLGAQAQGMVIWEAIRRFGANAYGRVGREAHYGFGYSKSYNPGGNFFEGLPWVATTVYQVGDLVSNDSNKVYRCNTGGTSAGSGGPTGTGSGIADGTVVWDYSRAGGMSVLASGNTGTIPVVGGITTSGTLFTGATMSRQAGSASGTIAYSQPTYSGAGRFKGQSQRISFALGGGTANEAWRILLTSASLAAMGITSDQLNNDLFEFSVSLRISAIANMYCPSIQLFGNSGILSSYDGYGSYSGAQTGGGGSAGYELMPSNGGFFDYPNDGHFQLKTTPCKLPNGYTTVNTALYFNFNASGGAGSATADIEIFNINLQKANV